MEWKEPSVKNGIIWWYDVQVRKNGVQIKDDKTERTIITINGLEPFTEYAFHVKTRGSADYSDAAVVSNKTSPSSKLLCFFIALINTEKNSFDMVALFSEN